MELTKMNFDLNPDTFTLDNMFAMELHRFNDIIQDIVGSAVKELSIEKGITEVAETWGNMKFTVYKYMKGTQERGKDFYIIFCKLSNFLFSAFQISLYSLSQNLRFSYNLKFWNELLSNPNFNQTTVKQK